MTVTSLRLRLLFCFPAVVLGLAATLAGAPTQAPTSALMQPPAETGALTATIPIDPQITTGRFSNGLRYYIRQNKKPENRAELRLVVNAGSVLEEDDQRGLAHFVEHMAFNGTKNFPKMEIVSFMESIGMRFGPSVNASTSYDETVYMLQIPTDRPEVIDRAMLVLEDWAQNLTFDPVEIDKERGVIIEEWRLRRGASARVNDKQLPVLLQNSQYAVRNPIGTTEVLQNFKHPRLIQFYKDWYRPDLMAVIAVGDFDKPAMQQIITKHFGALRAAVSPKTRPIYSVPDRRGTSYTVVTDPELTGTTVSVYNTMPARDETTIGAYRQQQIVDGLFSSMLNDRFGELTQKPGAPFLGAGAGHGSLVRTTEAAMLSAAVREGEVERGLQALFTEAERVSRFGFTSTELDRAKQDVLRALDRAVVEKDNQISANLAAEYSRNFLTGEPLPGIVYENALYKRFVPGVTLAELNQLAKEWWPDRNRVVMVSGPAKPGVTMPTEAKLAAAMAAAGGPDLKAYVDTAAGQPLIASPPTPGRVASVNTRAAFGITEWKLSNGVTVILKPTTFRQDEVTFRAFSPGGLSLASDADWVPALTAATVIGTSGAGTMSAVDLGKALTAKVASVQASIGMLEESLSGSASTKDLETLFELIYLRMTQPRADPEIFKVIQEQTRISLTNQSVNPSFVFGQTLNAALTQDHPKAKPLTIETLNQMDLAKSLAFYKDRFADASDFTFVFVGSFEPAVLQPLVERYLASLPALNRKETWKDLNIRPPATVVDRRVVKGIEPRSQSAMVFTGPFEYDQQHRTVMRAMGMALEGRLRLALREELGGTYSVSASPGYSKMPIPQYSLQIAFNADPARLDALMSRTMQEIERLKMTGPTDQELNDVRAGLLREYEASTKTNAFWLGNIANRYQLNEELDSLFTLDAGYKALTPAAIQDAARTYLNPQRMVKVVLVPEK